MIIRAIKRMGQAVGISMPKQDPDAIGVIFTCPRCSSESVVALSKMFAWKTPTFECLGCSHLIDEMKARLVCLADIQIPKNGSVCVHPI